jgi:hypothetical protein
MVEPSVLVAIDSGKVPPSITLDYLLRSRNEPAKVAIYVAGSFTAIIVVLRCFTRWWVQRFWIDDTLAVISLVCSNHFPSESRQTNYF